MCYPMATFAKKFLGLFRTLLHLKAVQIRFKLINKETECIEIKKKPNGYKELFAAYIVSKDIQAHDQDTIGKPEYHKAN